MSIGTFSRNLAQLPGLGPMLGESVIHLRTSRSVTSQNIHAIAGWGLRPSTHKPRALAAKLSLPFISLEDGFLRSHGTGPEYPTLSLVVDPIGIYYAADRPSALENLLESDTDVLSGVGSGHAEARFRVVSDGLSKYNAAPDASSGIFFGKERRILVVDQTKGDSSVSYGLASAESFAKMLAAARNENPDAVIYVKTHPEVSNGAKQGYLGTVPSDPDTVLLRDSISPASLFPFMDRVYVVTSQMGFEALLHNVPVTCFGMPWYAGWGCTDDRQRCSRRTRGRSVDELFAAAYMHYTRYLHPETHQRGTIFDVIEWLSLQRRMHSPSHTRTVAIGYRRWKAENVKRFLGGGYRRVQFVPDIKAAEKLEIKQTDRIVAWGAAPSEEVTLLAQKTGASLLRMEDGFIRSIGLGSDFIAPHSLVIDSRGLYFDARQPSDLEHLLNHKVFTERDIERATRVRALIVDNQLTKYNIESHKPPTWRTEGRRIVLVPGQVEDDASIKFGSGLFKSNLSLLRAAREACPNDYLVYKPHPDVRVRNRKGSIHRSDALLFADTIETEASIVSCIEASAEVHTMTSLSGFDALLRGKSVVVYGSPFYSGWGLTEDKAPVQRRLRKLTLDELIAGAMLHYPIYWDWTLNGFTSCEAAIQQLIHKRAELIASGNLSSVRKTYLSRQFHKLKLWAKAGFVLNR